MGVCKKDAVFLTHSDGNPMHTFRGVSFIENSGRCYLLQLYSVSSKSGSSVAKDSPSHMSYSEPLLLPDSLFATTVVGELARSLNCWDNVPSPPPPTAPCSIPKAGHNTYRRCLSFFFQIFSLEDNTGVPYYPLVLCS